MTNSIKTFPGTTHINEDPIGGLDSNVYDIHINHDQLVLINRALKCLMDYKGKDVRYCLTNDQDCEEVEMLIAMSDPLTIGQDGGGPSPLPICNGWCL